MSDDIAARPEGQLVPFSPFFSAVVPAFSIPPDADQQPTDSVPPSPSALVDAFHAAASTACPLCRRPFVFRSARASAPHVPATSTGARPVDAIGSGQLPRNYFKQLLPADVSQAGARTTEPEQTTAEPHIAGGYYAEHFEEVCSIGRGSFGSVHVCRHVVGGEVVGIFAVKKVPVGDDAQYLRKVLSEVKLLEQVRHHPNVIQYHHSWLETTRVSDFGPQVRTLFILMEYAAHGSLDSMITSFAANLTDDAVWYLFLSVLRGLRHLHSCGILHRDIKAENVLLASNYLDAATPDGAPRRRHAPRPVIADFGTSGFILRPEDVDFTKAQRTGGTGTQDYMAPELLARIDEMSNPGTPNAPGARHGTFVGVHTVASDLYATGVLLHQLAFAGALPTSRPFPDHNRPPAMVALIRALLQSDPRRRPSSCAAILDVPEVVTKWNQVKGLLADQMAGGSLRTSVALKGATSTPMLLLPSVNAASPAPSPEMSRSGPQVAVGSVARRPVGRTGWFYVLGLCVAFVAGWWQRSQ